VAPPLYDEFGTAPGVVASAPHQCGAHLMLKVNRWLYDRIVSEDLAGRPIVWLKSRKEGAEMVFNTMEDAIHLRDLLSAKIKAAESKAMSKNDENHLQENQDCHPARDGGDSQAHEPVPQQTGADAGVRAHD